MSTATAVKAKILTAAAARKLHRLEVKATRAERAFAKARKERAEQRTKILPLLPKSTASDDAERDAREAVVGGVRVRVVVFDGPDTFSFADYKKAGGKVTPAMEPHVKDGTPREKWTVASEDGPAEPAA